MLFKIKKTKFGLKWGKRMGLNEVFFTKTYAKKIRLGKAVGGGERSLKVNAARPYIHELSAKSPRHQSH